MVSCYHGSSEQLFLTILIFLQTAVFHCMLSTAKGEYTMNFCISQNNKLMRLTNFTTSLDFSLSELLAGDKDKKKIRQLPDASGADMFNQDFENARESRPEGYRRIRALFRGMNMVISSFDVPWSMNVSYSLNYSKPGLKSTITQALTLNGNVSLTKKMAITYTSGYDFTGKQITMTQIGITRDLHCWEMNLNWIPNGTMKRWNLPSGLKHLYLVI